jgi:lysostaphin
MRTILYTLSLFTLLAAVPWLVGARRAAAQPGVTIALASARVPQGGSLFVTVTAPGAAAVTLTHGTAEYPAALDADGCWTVVVPVWMETGAGAQALTATAQIDGTAIQAQTVFTITSRAFPTQRLRMARNQATKYESPGVADEYRLIGAALRRTLPRAWTGAFPLPAKGRLSTRYGTQRYRNGEKVSIHKGIDIAAPAGTPVYAANDGMVTLRRDFDLHGRTLVVHHGGGVAGLYLHLRDFGVSEGQRVKKGQLIARMGSTGVSTGAHLHYALYAHGVAIDPLLLTAVPAGW